MSRGRTVPDRVNSCGTDFVFTVTALAGTAGDKAAVCATSFAGGKAYGVFAVAKAKRGSTFDQAIYTTKAGFDVAASQGLFSSVDERPAVAHGDSSRSPTRSYNNRLIR